MSISETAPVTHMPDNSAQDYGHGPSRLNIFGKYDDFVANEKMLDGLSSAYIRSFNREPWNELYTPDQVKGKLERQLTIPGTNPIIVTLENAGRFGFAWGCDGPADVIIPEAVENDFPDLSLGMKEQVGALLVKKASQVTPDGQIFWGCELGVDPPGGSFFLRLVREEARRASAQTLFGMTKEGTAFLTLMRSRGGLSEVEVEGLPEGCGYFFQDLGRFVKREDKHD